MGDYYKLELELCSFSGDNLTIVHTGPPTVLDNWDKSNDFIIDTGRRTTRGDENSPDYMSWYNKVSHPLFIREIKSNTTAAGSSYNCIIKDKPAGYDRLVNRFKRVSKMLTACLKSGDPMPAEKIKEARDLVDNMDNEDYAAQFGEKVTKRHP